jgi:type I restriction enzyme S subunit
MSNRVLLESIVAKIGNGIDAEQIDQPSDGMLPISRIETIWDGVIDFERVKYAEVTKAEIDKYALQSGDILFSHINSPTHIGKTAIYRSDQTLIHGINLLLIRVDQKKCYPEYLNYYFKSDNVRALFRARCKKAVNQASLNQPDVLSLEVPLPPLTEQKRIASLLARADRLRRLRGAADDLGDALLQSVFLEMFGDVVRNEKGWEKAAISDLGKVQTGNTPSREEPENFGDFIEWIKSDNIRDEQLYVSPSREKLSELGLKKGRTVDAGAVLITCIAGSLDHIGDTSLTDRTVSFNQQINAVCPFDDVNPLFLRTMLHIAKPYVQYNASAGMKHIITKSKLDELVLVKPPLSLQEEFAGVVARVESLRGRMSESTRQVEGLFESLLAEAFS